MSLPYENATSGDKALKEIERLLKAYGCTKFGVMKDWDRGCILVQFQWQDRTISLEASFQGYAQMWLKKYPWNTKRAGNMQQYSEKALHKGELAAPSILRDWIKGQVAAVECGLMPFDHAFMPYMMLPDGTRAVDRMIDLLPAPDTNTTDGDQ